MHNTTLPFYHQSTYRWQLAFTGVGTMAVLACGHLRAQTNTAAAAGSGTIQPLGPRSLPNGTNFYNVAGSANGNNASFGVLDFSAAAFGFSNSNVAGIQGGNITLTLTESNGTFSRAGTVEFYLTTNNSASIAAGTSTLKFQNSTAADPGNTPYGIDPLLGALPGSTGAATNSYSLFDLSSAAYTPQTPNSTADTYVLSLSATAVQAFVNSLSSSGGGSVRLVMAVTTAAAEATYAGATNFSTNQRPLLRFTPTYSTANQLDWQGGSSTWTATGGTSWNPSNTGPGTTAWNNDGTHSAVFAESTGSVVAVGNGINASGLQFGTNGYVLNAATAGNVLTLSGAGPIVEVTNAADTATVNVALGGSAGMVKTGAGTLVLGGTNGYGGTTTVSAGTLQVGADAALGAAGTPVVMAGGTLQSGVPNGTLTLARAISGSGGLGIGAGSTLAVSGVVNAGTIVLPGGGALSLTNVDHTLANGASNGLAGLVFQTAGGSLQTLDAGTLNGLGVLNLGPTGIVASQASGSVSATSIFVVAGTVPIGVANAGATLDVSGLVSGAAVLAKTGVGTLVLRSDNSALGGLVNATTGVAVSFRQGTAGASPASGGIVSIAANNPSPGNALGTGEFQANGGTISNDTGGAITLAIRDISLGAQNVAGTPGGLVFAGNGAITVTGAVSLFKSGTTTYQHALTVNTPTTFSGVLTASANTTNSTGLTILGSSTLTLNGTTPNTLKEAVLIATSGANAGVVAAADGAFAANAAVTLNAGARLTLNTGALTGTVDTINDGALLSFNTLAGAFGKLVLNLGTGTETVGGLFLAANDGTLAAGYLPAGTYGSSLSTADHKDDTLFSGTGVLLNLNAVPEPSAWAALGSGGVLAWVAGRRRGRRPQA